MQLARCGAVPIQELSSERGGRVPPQKKRFLQRKKEGALSM